MYVVSLRKGFGGIPYGQLLINCVPYIKVIYMYECGSLVGEAYIALPGYQKETGCPDHMRVNHIIQFTVHYGLIIRVSLPILATELEGLILIGLDFCGSIYRDQCAHCYMYMYMYM